MTKTLWQQPAQRHCVLDAGMIGRVSATRSGRSPLLTFLLTSAAAIALATPATAQVTVGGDVSPDPWTPADVLVIGDTALGTMTVEGGSTTSSSGGRLGNIAGSMGEVTVTGFGSRWDITNRMTVGNLGGATLRILDGGVVTTGNWMDINYSSDTDALVTVSGVDSFGNASTLEVGDVLTVGYYNGANTGSATLMIENGGVVISAAGQIGYGVDSSAFGNGAVTVTGSDGTGNFSTWEVTGELAVGAGEHGTGSLAITDGGVVESAQGTVGKASDSTGSVQIEGTDARWLISDYIDVGDEGVGSVRILSGGLLETGFAALGYSAGGSGYVEVTGPNSRFIVNTTLGIGVEGSGELRVSAGGYVWSEEAYIGDESTASGTVTVSGLGSLWVVDDRLSVGYDGEGYLFIEDGGRVTAAEARINDSGASNASVTVSGPFSRWEISGDLEIGEAGAGQLTIIGGGVVTSNFALVSNDVDAVGTVLVTGAGSRWENNGDIKVGDLGRGTMRVDDGGVVASGFGVIGDDATGDGEVTISGANSLWDIGGDLQVGRLGKGVLDIEAEGVVISTSASIAHEAGSEGEATVSGAGARWQVTNELSVGREDAGKLLIENQAAVTSGTGVVGQFAGSSGEVDVEGASWTMSGDLHIGSIGNGTLTISEGGHVSAAIAHIADGATSTSSVFIGAATGQAAASAGTLAATELRFGSGTGTLAFNHTDTDYEFDTRIAGSGAIEHHAGTTTYTGDGSAFAGQTTVAGGALYVGNASGGTLGGSLAVQSGGVLGGIGTIGALTVQSGGIHAPGNSIGTQTINGSYLLHAAAILEIETNAAGQSDLVIVNGTVDITGATLRVLAEGGAYAAATDYLIIDNDGADAVTGTFGPVTSNLAFLDPTVVYDGGDGNDVVLTLTRNDVEFTQVAATPNQRAVAGALNHLPLNSALVNAIVGQSADSARQAFDALSGEVHATLGSTLARDARFTRGAIFSRLQQAHHAGTSGSGTSGQTAALGSTGTTSVAGSFDAPMMGLGMGSGKSGSSGDDVLAAVSPFVFWVQGFGSWADFDGDGNAASADRTIGGFLSGSDADLGNGWRAGFALGYSRSNVSVAQRNSSAEIDSYHLAAYAGGTVGAVALRAGGSWSWNDIDTERTVAFPGFLDSVEADYNGDTGQVFGEISLPLNTGAFAYEPFANLAYVHVSTDRFAEQGGAASLSGLGGDEDVGFSMIGVRFAWDASVGGARIVPRVSFAWQHVFGDVDPTRSLALAGGPNMMIAGTPLARDTALIEAGLDLALSPSATLGITYNGEMASDVEDHGVSGRINLRF